MPEAPGWAAWQVNYCSGWGGKVGEDEPSAPVDWRVRRLVGLNSGFETGKFGLCRLQFARQLATEGRIRIAFLARAVLFCGLLAPAGPAAAQMPPSGPPAVGVVRAARMPITETDEFIGRIESINRVALVARVTAFLDKRLFVEGSEVKQGDLLYQLEAGPFQADVEAKQAALGQANALLPNATQTLNRAAVVAEYAGRPAVQLR